MDGTTCTQKRGGTLTARDYGESCCSAHATFSKLTDSDNVQVVNWERDKLATVHGESQRQVRYCPTLDYSADPYIFDCLHIFPPASSLSSYL